MKTKCMKCGLILIAVMLFASCNTSKYYFNKRIGHTNELVIEKKVEIDSSSKIKNVTQVEELIYSEVMALKEPTSPSSNTTDSEIETITTTNNELDLIIDNTDATKTIKIEKKSNHLKKKKEKAKVEDYVGGIIAGLLLLLFLTAAFIKLGIFLFTVIGFILLAVAGFLCLIGILFAINYILINV